MSESSYVIEPPAGVKQLRDVGKTPIRVVSDILCGHSGRIKETHTHRSVFSFTRRDCDTQACVRRLLPGPIHHTSSEPEGILAVTTLTFSLLPPWVFLGESFHILFSIQKDFSKGKKKNPTLS